jgi:hypothetical protein
MGRFTNDEIDRQVKKHKLWSLFKSTFYEIALIVIGILVAFEIDNWKISQQEKKLEIDILSGVMEDIGSDTLDMNHNIARYIKYHDSDRITLRHLITQKPKTDFIVRQLERFTREDYTIILHHSHFEEAKAKGLSIISNDPLRAQISKLYEFDYPYLTYSENEDIFYDHMKIMNKALIEYIDLDSNGINISGDSYMKILNDKNIHFLIDKGIKMKVMLLEDHFLPKKLMMLNTIHSIDGVLSMLKED